MISWSFVTSRIGVRTIQSSRRIRDYVPFRTIYISRETRASRVHAEFDDYFVDRGLVKFGGMAVYEGSRDRPLWRLSNSFPPTRDPPQRKIDDRRSGEQVVTRSALTEPEIDARQIPLPAFGDVEPFLRCVDQCLRDQGVASWVAINSLPLQRKRRWLPN